MYTIYMTNFGYRVDKSFEHFDQAYAEAIKRGFECGIELDGRVVASWHPLRGLKYRIVV